MKPTQIDLSELAWDRQAESPGAVVGKRTPWLTRYVIPISILLGFIALFSFAMGSHLFSRRLVMVVPVMVQRGEVTDVSVPLFQTAGWVEPCPTAVSIPALTAGVIEELLVVEGQTVAKGEAIAKLISIDAELAVRQVETVVAIREGELQRAKAEQAAALIRLERPVHLRSELAEADSFLARGETERFQLPYLVQSSRAQLDFETTNLKRKRTAGDAIAGIALAQAQRDYDSAVAKHNELLQRGGLLEREIATLQSRVTALREQLELLVDERRQVDEAKARVASAVALLDQAKVELEQAKLSLERTVIRSPLDGRILRVLASPGTRVMGIQETAGPSSGTIAQIYNPKQLQVRADVRLEDVPMITVGAPVLVRTASSQKPLQGRVLQQTSSANIQKNTLEVKVELLDPPPTVGPEMLATATFMAPPTIATGTAPVETASQQILIPQQLVQRIDGATYVWRIGPGSTAQLISIQVGDAGNDGLVVVNSGLEPTDKIIVPNVQQQGESAGGVGSGSAPLRDGEPVTVVGEDASIGIK